MDHSVAPVLEALEKYHRNKYLPFTPPGHKQGRGTDPRVTAVLGEAVFQSDLLATDGLDDRRSAGRVLKRAQELMAEAVRAEHAFFSTCGSSLSVKSAMLSVAGPHQKLLISRDAHKSVISGLILAGIEPVWVEPNFDPELRLAHPPAAQAFKAGLDEHPDARGALVTSPTPYGTCADLTAIAEVCHERGLPLIVDEAWGAHLPFHPTLPAWAMDAGADVCVTSVHKMGAGLEQGSVFHLRGELIDPGVLKARADLLGTTSPSVLVYAALDGWRRQMVQDGWRLLDDALDLARTTRAAIGGIDGLHVHGTEFLGPDRAADQDPLQVVIDLSGLGITGYQAADWLHAHHRVNVHLADHRRIAAQLSYADDETTASQLVAALEALSQQAGDLERAPQVAVPSPERLRLEQVMSPRDAFFGETEQVPLDQAAGRVAAEMLTPCPPGIPAALPGERLTGDVLDYLRTGVRAGMVIPDAVDEKLESVRVVKPR